MLNRAVRTHEPSYLRCVNSCLLVSNRAGQSELSGSTFPIGTIRMLDRRQCTQNHNGEKIKNRNSRRITFPFLIYLKKKSTFKVISIIRLQRIHCQGSESMNENKTGENTNPKIYIYVYIYIYLYIYEVCIHKKMKKTPTIPK